ncbi:MAG: multiheme c-type cytochrome [Planctomycetota bacterium]
MLRVLTIAALGLSVGLLGCPPAEPPPGSGYNNTTDPTNGGARFVGGTTCAACHPDYAETSRLHAHAQALEVIQNGPPTYPNGQTRAGVPLPPPGAAWEDVSYVVGGYTHGANFVDQAGFLSPTQWNLVFPANGTPAGFDAPSDGGRPPFGYDCFRCHVTGARPADAPDPQPQGNRPGIDGSWYEAGVQCEACHGPGSNHVPNPQRRELYVDPGVQSCAFCHAAPGTPEAVIAGSQNAGNFIPATDGYVAMFAQLNELRASGGHARFTCGICHDPHASAVYDPQRGIRNACPVCHADVNLPLHEGAVYANGDYVEPVTCQSCHMPFAGLAASTATPEVLGGTPGRIGDVRSHIFRIDPNSASFLDMLAPGGGQVALDAQGRAAVTLDYICLRCHTGTGNALLLAPEFVLDVAPGMHARTAGVR